MCVHVYVQTHVGVSPIEARCAIMSYGIVHVGDNDNLLVFRSIDIITPCQHAATHTLFIPTHISLQRHTSHHIASHHTTNVAYII